MILILTGNNDVTASKVAEYSYIHIGEYMAKTYESLFKLNPDAKNKKLDMSPV